MKTYVNYSIGKIHVTRSPRFTDRPKIGDGIRIGPKVGRVIFATPTVRIWREGL